MMKYLRWVILLLVVMGLIASFWFSQGWLQLCAGLAIFLFGMQCLEDGLRQLAGSKLEQILGAVRPRPSRACCSASAAPCCCSPAPWCRC